MKRILIAVLLATLPAIAVPTESEDARIRRELDEKCRAARAAALEPIQRRKVEECLREPPPRRAAPRTREQCEAFYRDFGWGSMTADGTRNPNLFADIPECVAAHEARRGGR